MTDSTTKSKKWNEAAVATLTSIIGTETPVSAETVAKAAAELEVSERSVAAKLRQLDIEVASLAKVKPATFTPEEGDKLAAFVTNNAGVYTYKEIAEEFPGEFTPKQIQGKLLALELTDKVRPTERVEVARMYTEEEEAKFVKMANAGAFIEEIAEALDKQLPSVRGKALSLSRAGLISEIPKQKVSHAKNVVDPVKALGETVNKMTVADIAKTVDMTERGVRTLLTRRGITVVDYDGAAKRAKAEAKLATTA